MTEGIAAVPGFAANGIHAGIKAEGKKDLSLIFSIVPAQAAGMFTSNAFKAAPVLIGMERIKSRRAQAILTNSGNANAATGDRGYADALAMTRAAAGMLKIHDDLVLVASTGIIGQPLPIDKITEGIPALVSGLRPDGIADAEEGIMTTDKFPKISIRKAVVGEKEITLCGIAKGAGMISPHMATMLAFFMTDADIDESALQSVFHDSVNRSFNAITVDGCMSTNDTAILLANGVAGNRKIRKGTRDLSLFNEMLLSVMLDLAKAIVRDGEGATKVIEIIVKGAASTSDARKAAYSIGNSNLVKTAFFGCDPNWGRIIAAVGAAGITLSPDSVKVFLEDIPVFVRGTGLTVSGKELNQIMAQPEIRLTVEIGAGKEQCSLLASDLGHEYIKINAHYHT